jgi:hypothetical protein
MNQLTVVLITALVTGVVSVSGIWFGSYLTRGNEDRKWRRDQALEAYSEFIRLVNAITVEAGNVYVIECGTEEFLRHQVVLFENLAELYRTNDRVILLASDELQAPLTALIKHVTGAFVTKSSQCPKAPDAEVKADGARLAELNTDFIFKARNDLGVLGTPKKPRWWFWR